ncbi:hypothetical protein F5Y05DRAFT_42485 [Hypoxylon sp. FL0543]|nr:hypothetical protein F5Y05DRAFT_42485 [Hypoxylon sp. FL0543]
MEVLGTVAAAGQLIGTAIKILDSIAQLREFLHHAPARYQGWHSELAVLDDTVSCIRHNSALQTGQISRIIEAMAPKIETLTGLCLRHTPEARGKLVSRLNRAFTARAVESRILQSFQSLEHGKTALILTISALKVTFPIEQSPLTRQSQLEENTGQAMQNVSAGLPQTDPVTGGLLHLEVEDNRYHGSGLFSSTQPIQRYAVSQTANSDQTSALIELLRNYMSSQSTCTANVGELPRQGISGQRSTFKNISLDGDACLFGDTTGNGADFDGITIVGYGRVDGKHSGETALAWLRSSRPFRRNDGSLNTEETCQGIVVPTPMDGVLQSSVADEESKCNVSKASDASKTGLNKGDADEIDIEKD